MDAANATSFGWQRSGSKSYLAAPVAALTEAPVPAFGGILAPRKSRCLRAVSSRVSERLSLSAGGNGCEKERHLSTVADAAAAGAGYGFAVGSQSGGRVHEELGWAIMRTSLDATSPGTNEWSDARRTR